MSEIKVNKISPRTACGTTTLGDSGDTFTIPAGVSITNNGTASGFGATGSASWNTTVKTGDFTAVAGEGYFVNTTSGEIDVALPAGTAGAVVAVKDYANTFDTNNCILVPNGSEKIGGVAANAKLSIEGQAVTLVFIDSTKGWLVTDSGLQSDADNNPFIVATGGTITTSGNDRIHTFTGPGTFAVSAIGACAANNEVSYVVVAGGGGGGAGITTSSGAGGAGGYRETKSPVTPYTASPLDGQPSAPNRITVTATSFPIVVGGGGAGGAAAPSPPVSPGTNGSNSSFSTITATGGGRGAKEVDAGGNGGSGGGGGGIGSGTPAGGCGNTPPTTPAQGTNGGTGGANPAQGGGGGGGATVAGGAGSGSSGGNGGAGATSSINGTPTTRAGGGAGANSYGAGSVGNPGPGGGGTAGNDNPAGNGTDNTGGGGGAVGGCAPNGVKAGGTGGSGIVIIRYKFQ